MYLLTHMFYVVACCMPPIITKKRYFSVYHIRLSHINNNNKKIPYFISCWFPIMSVCVYWTWGCWRAVPYGLDVHRSIGACIVLCLANISKTNFVSSVFVPLSLNVILNTDKYRNLRYYSRYFLFLPYIFDTSIMASNFSYRCPLFRMCDQRQHLLHSFWHLQCLL
jgi:hypothetical protein